MNASPMREFLLRPAPRESEFLEVLTKARAYIHQISLTSWLFSANSRVTRPWAHTGCRKVP